MVFYIYVLFTLLFINSTRSPAAPSDNTKLDMQCNGQYGGPAFPWVVLGGYDGKYLTPFTTED